MGTMPYLNGGGKVHEQAAARECIAMALVDAAEFVSVLFRFCFADALHFRVADGGEYIVEGGEAVKSDAVCAMVGKEYAGG